MQLASIFITILEIVYRVCYPFDSILPEAGEFCNLDWQATPQLTSCLSIERLFRLGEYMMSTTHRSRKVITLVVTCLGSFMVLLDTSIVVTALPTIQSSFHANLADLQWAVDAFTLSFAALMLTGGTLGDRFGRKRFFLLGLILI